MKNLIVVCTMVLGIANMANADVTAVYDHFDDGVLDPDWSVSFVNSTDWTYAESGTNLTVEDIAPTVINGGSGGTWAQVILSQTFDPLTNFDVDFDFSWTSGEYENPVEPAQTVGIYLYDAANNQIAAAAYIDSHVAGHGRQYAFAGGSSFNSSDDLPFNGMASVDISRVGDNINVSWDGSTLISGSSSSALSRVDLVFEYYAYNGIYGPSFFDSESIDLVNIQGQVVPVPGAFILGCIGMGFAGWKMRRRKTL